VSLLYAVPRLLVLILSVQFEVKKKNKFWKQANILPSLKLQVTLSVQLLPAQGMCIECDIMASPLHILKHHDSHFASNFRQNNFHYLYNPRRPPMWSSDQSSWLHNGDVLCFL
jgi:hypothetical protein